MDQELHEAAMGAWLCPRAYGDPWTHAERVFEEQGLCVYRYLASIKTKLAGAEAIRELSLSGRN